MTSKLSSNSLMKNLSISATASTTEILLKVSLSLVLLALSYSYQKTKRRPFPSALPFFCNISILLELPYLISQIGGPGEEEKKTKKKYKNIRHFFHCKRKELQSDIFFLSPMFASGRSGDGDVLCITTPEDQAILMKKEKYLEFCLPFPETALRIEGKNNLQSLRTGKAHSAYRKIFSSILSPRALNSFTPYILSSFQEMWEELEKKSSLGTGEEQHIRLTIRETQLRLMCKILYGMTYETEEEEKQFQQFCEDFELAEKGLFPPGGVKTEAFKKGMEAKNRIAKVLYERFDKIYQERLKIKKEEKEKDQAVNVGNAMVIIADALIQDMKNDSSISYEVARENLYLLLEASHSTTMHITSAMMYFLNHPDYKEKLKKLREEVSSIKEKVSLNKDNKDEDVIVTYDDLKQNMLFGDACIDESMRLATIVGSISYHVPSGKSVELKSHTLKGPIIFMMAHSHWYDDPSVFPNPDQFLPERWMKNENSNDLEVTSFARSVFKPFGDGRHICLGMKLARLVMHANLYCFASKQTRRIEFDHEKVVIEHGLFPEKKVSENFVGRVVS